MSSVKNPPRWAARQNPSYYIIFIHIPHNPHSISYNPSSKLRQGACFSMKASRPSAPKNSSREDLHTPDVSRLILCVDDISIKHTTNQLVSVSQESQDRIMHVFKASSHIFAFHLNQWRNFLLHGGVRLDLRRGRVSKSSPPKGIAKNLLYRLPPGFKCCLF